MFHGDADMTINYKNFTEAEKEWTDVLSLASAPTSTTMNVQLGNHQATRQQWLNSCGYVVLDGFTSIGGDHGPSDALFKAQYVIPFLGLDKVGAVDPEIAQCGSGGGSGTGGAAGTGGRSGAGGGGGSSGGVGGADGAGTGGATGAGGISGAGGTFGDGGPRSTGGASGDPGSGGTGGDGPSADGGGSRGASDEGAGGCSCAVGGSNPRDLATDAVLILGFAAITFARRRRA
jgi:hypothetical protein